MWLRIHREGDDHWTQLTSSPCLIGRDPECQLVLDDPKVSRRHAELRLLPDGQLELRDLGSSNGTFVDGARVSGTTTLSGTEALRFGSIHVGLAAARDAAVDLGQAVTQDPAVTVPPPPVPPPPQRPPGERQEQRSVLQRLAQPSRSMVERLQLQKGLRRATLLAGAALATTAIVLVLAFTGILTGGRDSGSAEVVAKVRPSTVRVMASVNGQPQSSGTGWALDAQGGMVVTNAHVVAGGTEFEVSLEGEESHAAEVVGVAPCEDLAVLRTDTPAGLQMLPLGDQSSLQQGDRVIAIGFPGSLTEEFNLVTTEGIVSVVRTSVEKLPNVIRTDAAINPGNSGGPLVDLNARLVGVNTLRGPETQNEGYAIGVDRVREIAPRLSDGHSLAWTGMGLDEVGQFAGQPPGIFISNVMPGSPASRARVPSPAWLSKVNGRAMTNGLVSYCEAVGEDPEQPADMTITPMSNLSRDAQGALASARFGQPRRLSVGFQ